MNLSGLFFKAAEESATELNKATGRLVSTLIENRS